MSQTLDVRHLRVEFPLPRGIARAVEDVSFTLRPGERLGLVGESGSGKTTTALAIPGMAVPRNGVLVVCDAPGFGLGLTPGVLEALTC